MIAMNAETTAGTAATEISLGRASGEPYEQALEIRTTRIPQLAQGTSTGDRYRGGTWSTSHTPLALTRN